MFQKVKLIASGSCSAPRYLYYIITYIFGGRGGGASQTYSAGGPHVFPLRACTHKLMKKMESSTLLYNLSVTYTFRRFFLTPEEMLWPTSVSTTAN